MTGPESGSTETKTVGECPRCHSSVPQSAIIIEYEVDDRYAAYAACPACDEIVEPT